MTPFMVAEWRGYGKLYYYPSEFYGVWGMLLSVAAFIVWTDFAIYWIHRWLHTFPTLYKYIHKEHHVWVIPTPWAAIAFHPLDGWAQEIPYLLFPFFFPLQKHLYLALYIFILSWTCSIHDRINLTEHPFINTAAHHDVSGACCFTKKENGFFLIFFFPPPPKNKNRFIIGSTISTMVSILRYGIVLGSRTCLLICTEVTRMQFLLVKN